MLILFKIGQILLYIIIFYVIIFLTVSFLIHLFKNINFKIQNKNKVEIKKVKKPEKEYIKTWNPILNCYEVKDES